MEGAVRGRAAAMRDHAAGHGGDGRLHARRQPPQNGHHTGEHRQHS